MLTQTSKQHYLRLNFLLLHLPPNAPSSPLIKSISLAALTAISMLQTVSFFPIMQKYSFNKWEKLLLSSSCTQSLGAHKKEEDSEILKRGDRRIKCWIHPLLQSLLNAPCMAFTHTRSAEIANNGWIFIWFLLMFHKHHRAQRERDCIRISTYQKLASFSHGIILMCFRFS